MSTHPLGYFVPFQFGWFSRSTQRFDLLVHVRAEARQKYGYHLPLNIHIIRQEELLGPLLVRRPRIPIGTERVQLNCNADGLSRLPLQDAVTEKLDDAGVFNLSQLDQLPVTADDIRRATAKDKTLSQVLRYTQEGWPTVQETPALEPIRSQAE